MPTPDLDTVDVSYVHAVVVALRDSDYGGLIPMEFEESVARVAAAAVLAQVSASRRPELPATGEDPDGLVAMYRAATTLVDRLQTLLTGAAALRAQIVRSLLAGRTQRVVGAMLGLSPGRVGQIAATLSKGDADAS